MLTEAEAAAEAEAEAEAEARPPARAERIKKTSRYRQLRCTQPGAPYARKLEFG